MRKYLNNLDKLDKIALIFVFALLMFIVILGCSKEQVITNDCLTDPDPNAVCTMEVDYQCGCNGYVYINPCYAYKDGVTRIRPISIDNPEDNCYTW